jgi:hypothetical protein
MQCARIENVWAEILLSYRFMQHLITKPDEEGVVNKQEKSGQ